LAHHRILVCSPDRLAALDAPHTVVLHTGALGGRELDPHAEAVLDAARGSALRVVLAGPAVPEEFASLADEVTGDLGAAIMRERDAGRTVLAVGRPDTDTAAALLNADVCVAVTDPDAPVLWQADILVTDGLPGVWRLLNAVSAATTNGHRATTLAKSGAALAGLLVATRQRRRSALLDPVTAAGLTALLGGWWAGLTAGNTRPPRGRRRVAWPGRLPRR
jgi:cation-transporting ATPase I